MLHVVHQHFLATLSGGATMCPLGINTGVGYIPAWAVPTVRRRGGERSTAAQCAEHLHHGLLTTGQKPQAQHLQMMQRKIKIRAVCPGQACHSKSSWRLWASDGITGQKHSAKGPARNQVPQRQQTGSRGDHYPSQHLNEKGMVGVGQRDVRPEEPLFSCIKQLI